MWVEFIAVFLAASILLYCLLAGADFGAGMLEAFAGTEKREEQKELITHAIGPVWEANHVWLILALVILFVAFPAAYSTLSVTFHIPLTVMLIGIILRGCAFTFRHYDAVKDESQNTYSLIFVVSSFLTPFALGVIAGGTLLGRTTVELTDFATVYIAPWLNFFCISVGIFTCVLFAFLAAVYLIGETEDEALRRVFIRRAKAANLLAIVSGLGVFVAAEISGIHLMQIFKASSPSVLAMISATTLLLPLWHFIRRRFLHLARLTVAFQVACVLLGWFALQFPILIAVSGSSSITVYDSAAPEPTLRYLLYALIGGVTLVVPALAYLLIVFKSAPQRDP